MGLGIVVLVTTILAWSLGYLVGRHRALTPAEGPTLGSKLSDRLEGNFLLVVLGLLLMAPVGLGGLGVLVWQVFHFLSSGEWAPVSITDALAKWEWASNLSSWAKAPTEMLGLWKVFGALPFSAAWAIVPTPFLALALFKWGGRESHPHLTSNTAVVTYFLSGFGILAITLRNGLSEGWASSIATALALAVVISINYARAKSAHRQETCLEARPPRRVTTSGYYLPRVVLASVAGALIGSYLRIGGFLLAVGVLFLAEVDD